MSPQVRSKSCSHPYSTCVKTEQVGLIGVIETYACDTPGCTDTFQVRSWAEAEDSGFAPENEEDDW
jgi:hypothetical protein